MLEYHKISAGTVIGPFGEELSFDSLPPPTINRWIIRRKAEVVFAVYGGLLTIDQACDRYSISPEELDSWQRAVERSGMPGLRVAQLKPNRDRGPQQPRSQSDDIIPAHVVRHKVAGSKISDYDYYAARAIAERELERRSPQRPIAAIHAQLAARYEQLASSAGEKTFGP